MCVQEMGATPTLPRLKRKHMLMHLETTVSTSCDKLGVYTPKNHDLKGEQRTNRKCGDTEFGRSGSNNSGNSCREASKREHVRIFAE